MTPPLKTPVAFIIFNRPKCTRRVFERIRDAQPEKLYLIADAPRAHKQGETEKCAETRRIVEEMIDWPCEVHKNYAKENMGCGKRIPSGLNWVFENEEQAIIMEDDILVDLSFFTFCEEMLCRHETDQHIMQVSGYNRFNLMPANGNYFLSKYSDFWGWATWRRAWNKFNALDGIKWQEINQGRLLREKCASNEEYAIRSSVMDDIVSGRLNAWGMKWEITRLINDGVGVVPGVNLVKNIGFGPGASHTLNPFTKHQLIKTKAIQKPFCLSPDLTTPQYDKKYVKQVYSTARLTKARNYLFHAFGLK